MDAWKQSATTGDLNEVPGIGPKTIEKLALCDDPADCITNTYQLFGKFLMLKGPGTNGKNDVEPVVHTEKFWCWLQNRGIASYRSAIVRAVSLFAIAIPVLSLHYNKHDSHLLLCCFPSLYIFLRSPKSRQPSSRVSMMPTITIKATTKTKSKHRVLGFTGDYFILVVIALMDFVLGIGIVMYGSTHGELLVQNDCENSEHNP
jgi:hypothetical protein